MNENRVVPLRQKDEIDDRLTEILRSGARQLITRAAEVEFDTFLALNAGLVLPDGCQRVVRHGYDPVRTMQARIGLVEVQKPKACDRAAPAVGERIRFGMRTARDQTRVQNGMHLVLEARQNSASILSVLTCACAIALT